MPEVPPQPAGSRSRRLWAYARHYKSWYAAGAVCLVLTNLAALAIPAQIGKAVQIMRDANAEDFASVRGSVVDAGLLIIVLAIAAGIARVGSRISIFNAGRFVEFDLRNELYRKLSRLGPNYFAQIPTGDLTSRVANDVTYVRVLFALPFLHIINTVLAYSIALHRMVVLDWSLTLWCLLPYPILLLFVGKVIRAMFAQTKVVQAQLASISSKVQENLTGAAVVKTYALQDLEEQRFGSLNQDYVDKSMRLATLRGGMTATMMLISGSGTLIVLFLGSQRVIAGTMQLGDFVAFNAYVVALAFPTMAMGWVFSTWHRGLAAFDRISEILDYEPEIADDPDAEPAPFDGEGAAIEIENVTFAYPGEEPVLKNVSATIPAGATVAFVGRTGSGKTTLMKLLSRFYDPDEGSVRIDGRDWTELPLRDTRGEFGVVPQGPFLFSMTVGNNLRFGLDALEFDDTVRHPLPTTSLFEPGVERTTDERVDESLQMAGLSDDIDSFPDGLETLVGERGITLSGGQKQRATIARALLVDPRILVLDDALSSVDTQTEATILDHLDTVMAGRTSIIVTHRFNALHRVDRIFVLDEGQIVEEGTHDELLRNAGPYAAMYARQRLVEELDQ